MSTIYILWLRQLKRYVRSKARMIGSLGQPVLFLVALGYGFGPIFSQAGQGNYIQFLAPGVIAMAIIFTAMFGGIEIIWDRQFGFLKETMVAPVSRFTIMFGRTLGGATVAMIQGTVVFLISLAIGFHPASWVMVPVMFLFMLLLALFFTSVGTAIASKLQDMQAFPLIMNFLMMPLFFLSGSLFPASNLSPTLSNIIKFNPLSYGVDGLRGTLTGVFHFGLASDFAILTVLTAITLAIGSWLFSRIEV